MHTSLVTCIDQDWRREKRLAQNPNSEGPLTNLPDYTYMDGRPTPLGVRLETFLFEFKIELSVILAPTNAKADVPT